MNPTPPVRTHARHEIRVAGKLFAPDLHCAADCTVLNISEGGALIGVRDTSDLPECGYLWQAATRKMLACQIRWRRLNLVGLQFTDPQAAWDARRIVGLCVDEPQRWVRADGPQPRDPWLGAARTRTGDATSSRTQPASSPR